MKIDLHIHTRDCSDGRMSLPEVFEEAAKRHITVISITDHDSIECQERAMNLAARYGMQYITGVELNISFSHPRYREGKAISLDVLGYQFDINNRRLAQKLQALKEYRQERAEKILQKINRELSRRNLEPFSHRDIEALEETVEGTFGRPHIANYMVEKGIVSSTQEAFDSYLTTCNVPKMPVSLEEASGLIHGAGGRLVLAHPSNPRGTSLVSLTRSLAHQQEIIREKMLPYLDGIECWHSSHDPERVSSYLAFAKKEGLLVTGGSDCHQQPVLLGSVEIPPYVAAQFGLHSNGEDR